MAGCGGRKGPPGKINPISSCGGRLTVNQTIGNTRDKCPSQVGNCSHVPGRRTLQNTTAPPLPPMKLLPTSGVRVHRLILSTRSVSYRSKSTLRGRPVSSLHTQQPHLITSVCIPRTRLRTMSSSTHADPAVQEIGKVGDVKGASQNESGGAKVIDGNAVAKWVLR
jgi:hypothetical protein